ncbi:MAG: tail fiber protein [Desulfobacteraceae bacterium]|nr:tail fiber protein [Desulfobacteraceae bacterium]
MKIPLFPLPPGQLFLQPASWVPIGSVMAFAGAIKESGDSKACAHVTDIEAGGWMLCDGRTLDPKKYPELFGVLGGIYGGDQKDTFCIPDYQGMFFRGTDAPGKIDPDQNIRTVPYDENKKSTTVGSVQKDALQKHVHNYDTASPAVASPSENVAGVPTGTPEPTTGPKEVPPVKVSEKETRPINIYVHYIIKFTNFPAWSDAYTNFPFHIAQSRVYLADTEEDGEQDGDSWMIEKNVSKRAI